MSELPDRVRRRLADPIYQRKETLVAREALLALGVSVPELFRAFYEQYEGPFGSEKVAFSLLDLCADSPNIAQATATCRENYGWPPHFLVLTEPLGNAVLVLDARDDQVFNVDFEGGDGLLLEGELAPAWKSFAEFLCYYF